MAAVRPGSWLNDPSFVDAEYASEQRLVDRNLAYRSFLEGVDAETVAFDQVLAGAPRRVLEDAGRLIAGTVSNTSRPNELDTQIGSPQRRDNYSFSSENGRDLLLGHSALSRS